MSETTLTVESSSTEGSSCCGSCGTGSAEAPAATSAQRAVFHVTGMTCGHCVSSVTAELKKVSGVTEVAVDLGSGEVTVDSTEALTDAAVAAAVEEAGYVLAGRL
ncbi:heavy-metal-associated domain-containing protein [Streptomyces sp. FH025]|uniref:heavy-metal-associated domain-containing protein n=1 Tax=Streptomyces sp. FH025 TaxID=2815937 RepID=UPI001A9FC24A|nr:cation transporter [Streptomyces sp. FH025]MBO1419020.1 heavy-metal-associated domain-containing protein [Streptomyces sp. FH025]